MKPSSLLAATAAAILVVLPSAHATEDQAAELVERGRRALRAGDLEAAEAAFQAATDADDGPATRPWLIRCWLEAGRVEDGLAATEEFEAAGAPEEVVAYLYGMGFRALALRQAAEGGNGTTALVFADAADWLSRAAETVGDRFPDVDHALAETAWYALDLETARAAAERAVARPEAGPDTWGLAGRIALSQYRAALDAEPDGAPAHLEQARAWLARAASAPGGDAAARADDWVQAAYVELFAEAPDAAAAAFARAVELAPEDLDFAYWLGALTPEGFDAALFGARAALDVDDEAQRARDGLLAWWQGYGHWSRNTRTARAQAEREFLVALDRNPEYANAWYYVATARNTLQDRAGVLDALRAYWDADPGGAAAMIAASERDVWMVEGLIGWCATGRGEDGAPADNEGAALLCELLAAAQPDEPRHWNNLGLFLRDAGDELWRAERAGRADRDVAERCLALWERALVAYRRALSMEPGNPVYLNDTAVVLHYNLGRELDEAADLYRRAVEAGERELARTDLPADLRAVYETARGDAGDNLRRVEALIRRRAEG